jgi:hypothetical protein
MDMYSLWWVEQTLNQRKTHFDFKHVGFVSYKNYVWRSWCQTSGGDENGCHSQPLQDSAEVECALEFSL